MLQKLIDFITGLRWQDWVTIGGFIFGLVSLIAYLEQRRTAKGNTKVVEWATRNLDKSISEEEITRLLAQKAAMEAEITRSIPALARAAVLKEQSSLHEKAVAEHFVAWQKLSAELGASAPISSLDPQMQQAILDRIVPSFQRQKEQNRLRTRLTVLSVGTATASAALPFGLGSFLAVLLAPALLSTAVRLYSLREEAGIVFKTLRPRAHLGYGITVIGLAGFGIALLSVGHLTGSGKRAVLGCRT